jgi:EAL domain-containing protein (putative c-di-GMP-specific phosphodiesterase class I)
MSLNELVSVPVAEIVRAHTPKGHQWQGLIIELGENQIIADIGLAGEIARKFARLNIKLAIDDFGCGGPSSTQLYELPFAELKISRVFVRGCAVDSNRALACRTAIDLAHNFGSKVVAVGIENARDNAALINMGCDHGQGLLLGHPMSEERLLSLLKLRASAPI